MLNSRALRVTQLPPHDQLIVWLSENRGEMRTKAIVAFKELIEKSKTWKE